MFRIKICGITNEDDAQCALEAGADAIGLNFYPASKRFVEASAARRIADRVRGKCAITGVFVNAGADVIRQVANDLRLDVVQLSGDETPELLRDLGRVAPIMRAIRFHSAEPHSPRDYLDRCRQLDSLPDLILWDAHDAAEYGGTGKRADWQAAIDFQARGEPPLVLAGGLTPENVAEAIGVVSPVAVDVASGVESSPSRKDHQRIRAFVEAARAAFDNRMVSD